MQEFALDFNELTMRLNDLFAMTSNYRDVCDNNDKLRRELLDVKGNLRVMVRVRPASEGTESSVKTGKTVDFRDKVTLAATPTRPSSHQRADFVFEKVFGQAASQEDVFEELKPYVRSVLEGQNVCVFAYGQTGSGKTFTMEGDGGQGVRGGVIPDGLSHLYDAMQSYKDTAFSVRVRFVEVYNEKVRDLLADSSSPKAKQSSRGTPEAQTVQADGPDALLELLDRGQRSRAVGSTAMNEHSSRSHSIFTILVTARDTSGKSLTISESALNLIDLAGSERVKKSEATGDRLVEARAINKSLSALGDVISALGSKQKHVPYRNSKLTQLLQESLCGGRVIMLAHIAPEEDSHGETLSTLNFAQRSSKVQLQRSDAATQKLKDAERTIVRKDAELEQLRARLDVSPPPRIRAERTQPAVRPQTAKVFSGAAKRRSSEGLGRRRPLTASNRRLSHSPLDKPRWQ